MTPKDYFAYKNKIKYLKQKFEDLFGNTSEREVNNVLREVKSMKSDKYNKEDSEKETDKKQAEDVGTRNSKELTEKNSNNEPEKDIHDNLEISKNEQNISNDLLEMEFDEVQYKKDLQLSKDAEVAYKKLIKFNQRQYEIKRKNLIKKKKNRFPKVAVADFVVYWFMTYYKMGKIRNYQLFKIAVRYVVHQIVNMEATEDETVLMLVKATIINKFEIQKYTDVRKMLDMRDYV